jgi:hypothetical protein
MLPRPSVSEYAQFYAGYVSRVPESDILGVLGGQAEELLRVARSVPPSREQYRYAPGKWSIREVFGHLIDAERVFGYRAFCITRGEHRPLPAFDEQAYVASSRYDQRTLPDLVREFTMVRGSHMAFLTTLGEAEWGRSGIAAEAPVSVRALAFIMAGHLRHHLNVLTTRYDVSR